MRDSFIPKFPQGSAKLIPNF